VEWSSRTDSPGLTGVKNVPYNNVKSPTSPPYVDHEKTRRPVVGEIPEIRSMFCVLLRQEEVEERNLSGTAPLQPSLNQRRSTTNAALIIIITIIMAAKDKAIIFYRCNFFFLFFYLVSIDET